MSNKPTAISQRKQLAMGATTQSPPRFAGGGSVGMSSALLKTGIRDNPIESVKRANGIPGMKKGGRC